MTDRTVTVHLNLAVTKFKAEGKEAEETIRRIRQEAKGLRSDLNPRGSGGSGGSSGGSGSASKDAGVFANVAPLWAAGIAAAPGALPIIGAGLAALPAWALSTVSAFGTLKIATHGLGDAFKAANAGDPQKLAQALAKLSYEGSLFVQEYAKIRPQLQAVAQTTQGALLRPLLGDMERLAGVWVPALLAKLPLLSQELGRGGNELVNWATAPATVHKISGQIDLAAATTHDWVMLLRNGAELILDLADSAEPFIKVFVHGLAEGTANVDNFVRQMKASGQWDRIFSNAEVGLHGFAQVLGDAGRILMQIFGNPALAGSAQALFTALHGGLTIVESFLKIFGSLPAPVQQAVGALGTAAFAVKILTDRLKTANTTAQKGAVILTALAVAGTLLNSIFSSNLAPNLTQLSKSMEEFGHTGKLAGEAARVFGKDFQDLDRGLQINNATGITKWWQDFSEGVVGLVGIHPFDDLRQSVQALDQELAAEVGAGHAADALAFLQARAKSNGVAIDDLIRQLPQYSQALAQVSVYVDGASYAQRKASESAKLLADGLERDVQAGNSLLDVFNKLNGGTINLAEAQIKFEAGIDNLTAAFKKNGLTLDIHTAKGRENLQALIDLAKGAADVAQKVYEETGSTQAAGRAFDSYTGDIRKALVAQGFSKQAAQALIDTFAKMPALKATQVSVTGIDAVLAKLRTLRDLTMEIGDVNVSVNSIHRGRTFRWGGITAYARDGLLSGAQVYSPVSPARFGFAEPATGGEAFIPRYGNYARSMSILDRAAGWYGATVMPGRGGSGGSVSAMPSPYEFAAAVRDALHGMAVTLDGRAVGHIDAKRADLLNRGG